MDLMAHDGCNKLTVGTYNCQHFKGNTCTYVKHVLSNCDILFMQEHCLYASQLENFSELGDINYYGCSPMDEAAPLVGRPFGGCAILWHNRLKASFKPLPVISKRICAGVLSLENDINLLLVNLYLPCDDRCRGPSLDQTNNVLHELASILSDCDDYITILGGDLNTDFSRVSPQVSAVKDFLQVTGLTSGLNHVSSSVSYTFESKGNSSRSLIDHICLPKDYLAYIHEYYTISSVENVSDHDALVCSLDIDITYLRKQELVYTPKPAWYKATLDDIAQFKKDLSNRLASYKISNELLHCTDIACTSHRYEIDELFYKIVESCLLAEESHIPLTGRKPNGCIPGWNDLVKAKRQESLYWHHLWKQQGRPPDGEVADQMRYTRKNYHAAVKDCQKNQSAIQSERMASALLGNRQRDFWSEVRRLSKSQKSNSAIVDNLSESKDIAKLFHDRFKELYTSVPSSQNEIEQLLNRINSGLKDDHFTLHKQSSNLQNLKKVLKKIKLGKSDGSLGLSSDSIVNGPDSLHVMISLLFKVMIVHGYAPDPLLVGTMTPLPKVKHLAHVADKYRAITLSSCILKLLDYVILQDTPNPFKTDTFQFGYKENSSTTLCSATLMETVSYFISNNTKVYAVLLDATKAFDRVKFSKLFNILLDRGLNKAYVRLLFYMYFNQKLRVKWQDQFSDSFIVSNGVKQGGVLSPVLFGVYMDSLLLELKSSGYGCHVGPHFAGCLGYADDVVLLSPTKQGLNCMLDIAECFSKQFSVEFNGAKSQYIIFDRKYVWQRDRISIFGSNVDSQEHVVHLGHTLYADNKRHNVGGILCSFYKQFNIFRSKFKCISSNLQAKLFSTYCTSFYGVALLPLCKLKTLHVAYRKSLRVVLNLPYRTHCGILNCFNNLLCEKHYFMSRFIKFAWKALNHESDVISYIFKQTLGSKQSVFYQNIKYCCDYTNFSQDMFDESLLVCMKQIRMACSSICKTDENYAKVNLIKELRCCKTGLFDINLMDYEIDDIIYNVCVN